jgi:predicted glycosyltransferase
MWGSRRGHVDDDTTAALLNEYFDAVLVHSDPAFARLEEFFRPRAALTTLVYHTGFVVRERQAPPPADERERRVLVSAGDGRLGGPLYRAAVEAHRMLWDVDRLRMTIIAGPSLAPDDWEKLQLAALRSPALTLQRSVSDLGAEFANVRWVVCACGYNAACDVMANGVAALFVPVGDNGRSEQLDRAQRLARWGICRTLMPHHVNGASVANGIHHLIGFEPASVDFNLNGAEVSANLIHQLTVFDEDDTTSSESDSGSDGSP